MARAMNKTGENSALTEWNGSFGLPDFGVLHDDDFSTVFDTALKAAEEEIEKIAMQPDEATIENFLIPFELSGKALDRVCFVFFLRASVCSNEQIRSLESDFASKLSRFSSRRTMDERLFAKINALYQKRETFEPNAETHRLIEENWKNFVRNGALLDASSKKRLTEINERLAILTALFNQNVLKDNDDWVLYLEKEEELSGLSHDLRKTMYQAARERGRVDAYAITLTRAIIIPFLTFSNRRDLREVAMQAWIKRGANGGDTDNNLIIAEIAHLRYEKAKILGFSSYAAFKLDSSMAKTPCQVMDLLFPIWKKAKRKAEGEKADLERVAADDGIDTFTAWDWRYYAEKLKFRKYAFDQTVLKPYFQLEYMIKAAFWVANQLFGLVFEEKKNVPLWHKDARLWLVKNADGSICGLFIGDYFCRAFKQSGAWMNTLQSQHKLGTGAKPIVYNITNFARSDGVMPTLLTLDDTRTLFHEFGHALHGLLSDVTWPSLSGTSVTRDFVEFPSQLYEHWLMVPEVMERFARHYKTGRTIPRELHEKILESKNFNSGFETVQYISSALIDMAFHNTGSVDNPVQFEQDELKKIGMLDSITMMHRLPHFTHIFSGDDYSAGYYSYLWSEMLEVDAFSAFTESGDVFNPELATSLKKHIYSSGGSADPTTLYEAFRGCLPAADAMIRERGLD